MMPGRETAPGFLLARGAKVRILADRSRAVLGGAGDSGPVARSLYFSCYLQDGQENRCIMRFTCSGLIGRAKAAHAASFIRRTSGATASSANALSAASIVRTL